MPSRLARRISTIILLAGAIVVAGASAGYALGRVRYWNSVDKPLTVSGYGSTGWGYGSWRVSTGTDGTRSRLGAHQAISNADDHRVFVKLSTWTNAGYCLATEYLQCTQQYFSYDDSDTGRTSCYCWEYLATSTGVNAAANYARAQVRVKLDVPWRPDPDSNPTYTKGDSY